MLLTLLRALPLAARLGLAAAALGALLGGVFYVHHSIYQDGYDAAAGKCDADKLRAQIIILQADLAAARLAASSAEALASEADDRASTLEERLSRYDDDSSAPAVCALDDPAVERLRALTQ